jgi:hypothetical protein
MYFAQTISIPVTDERATWPCRDDYCPTCNNPFGNAKRVRDVRDDGTRVVVHKHCSDGSYIRA